MAWPCENPNCAVTVHKRTVTVTVHDLWQCGDHDERPLVKAFITCSWACMAEMARDLAAAEEAPSEVPF